MSDWIPRTEVGRKVKSGEIKSIHELIDKGVKIKEAEIVDELMPNLESDLFLIGQSKGKFGGGQRRAFRQTQKKTKDGNKPKFTTMAVVGDNESLVGIGTGNSRETVPAREKALRKAKLNLITIKRGCGSWECGCKEDHSIPFKVSGKESSVEITLMPAPKGVGLCIHEECKKLLKLAGIKDVWSSTKGQTRSAMNLIKACFKALQQLSTMKVGE